jgi:hypothetical protein
MTRTALVVLACLTAFASHAESGVVLSFDSPVPGTLADANGLGTGFTNRLPGTGASIPLNDPKMDLIAQPGYLQLTASDGNIGGFGGGTNLGIADAPGIIRSDVLGDDLVVTASFIDVDVAAHQLAIYIGTESDRSIRAGFHGPYQIYLAANEGGAPDFGWNSGLNAFSPGDDIIITLQRTSGLWSVDWTNLTDPGRSGSSTTSGNGTGLTPFPELNAEATLYTGLIHAGSSNQIAKIDYFAVSEVPEPSTFFTWGIVLAIMASTDWFRRRRFETANRGRAVQS